MNNFNNDSLLAAHPIEIYYALTTVFRQSDWLSWEPETVLLSLDGEISDVAVDKVMAVQAVASNGNAVVCSAAAFEKTVNAFNNNICVMDVLQPPEIEEVSYAVSQIEKIIKAVHGADTKVIYRDEVPSYVASTAKFRDWFVLPKNLAFAQDMLDLLTGLDKESKLYKEHKQLVDTVSDFVMNSSRSNAREILESSSIVELETNDTATLIVKRVIGALLFDPTLPYRKDIDS